MFRLCVISDIHFMDSHNGDDDIEDFLMVTIKEINQLQKEKPIDLLVLNGDIAFKGNSNEYTDFNTLFLNKLNENIKIISNIGNHDCNNLESLRTFFTTDFDINKLREKIYDPTRFDPFITTFIGRNLKDRRPAGFNYFNVDTENKDMKTPVRHSYYYDKSNSIFFIFINSANHSLNEALLTDLLSSVNDTTKLKKLAGSGLLNDMGKQSYFLHKLNNTYNKIRKLRKVNKNLRVVTFAHLSPPWLNQNERGGSTDYKNNSIKLDSLLNRSDLFITGHDHVSMSHPNTLSKKCHQIEMGAFLDNDNITTTNSISKKFSNNWFSIIDIDYTGFQYNHYKLKADNNTIENWENKISGHEYFFQKSLGEKDETTPPSTLQYSRVVRESLTGKEIAEYLKKERNFSCDDIRSNINEYIIMNINGLKYAVYVNPEFNESLVVNTMNLLDSDGSIQAIAFYDVFYNISPKDLEDVYQEQFAKYQRFKYKFFETENERFKEIIKKKRDLNIIYDLISLT